MNTKELCFSLCKMTGTSGDEKEACLYAKELLSEYMKTEIDVKIKKIKIDELDNIGLSPNDFIAISFMIDE